MLPKQIAQWKKQLKEQSADFIKKNNNGKDEKDRLIKQPYKTIGKQTMDIDFLCSMISVTCRHGCGHKVTK